ncbi:DFP2-like protein [Euroglyphus maynei]|uniref:DFP2-like protein n=1 Tax=Euroglyphus maynei TaxID=6958 RepID=A0A1Y3BK73_EURMA|nr:DFP2-like protein [Euroglyphus maynei]
MGNYGSTFGGNNQGGGSGGSGNVGPITTAIESTRTVEVKPVQVMGEPHEPQVVEVPSEDMPVTVHFKSQSSRVLVQQTHTPAQIAEPEHTTSEDEPQRVIHEVVKPVIQEIREIIQPYRSTSDRTNTYGNRKR